MKKITNIADITSDENFEETVSALYGDPTGQLKRYCDLYTTHLDFFNGCNEGWFFSSPGRIEVVGNHTDHNNGKVLAAAVTIDKLAFVTPTLDTKAVIHSEGYPDIVCDLSDLTPVEAEKGDSVALVKGVAKYLTDNGYRIGGFRATVTGNVPSGAGVSSSASFEVLVAEILSFLYNNDKLIGMTKAMASQYAENVYFDKPCGLMDQSAIALGGVSMIDFNDLSSPDVLSVNWPFNQVDIVITNTGGNHCDLTGAYASIRSDMESIAEYYGEKTLRNVDYQHLLGDISSLQKSVSGRAILRALHYFDENSRVEKAVAAITYGNFEGFVKAVNDSGDSSYKLLQNCFVSGDVEERIPLALAVSKRIDGVLAARVHGGGFAGTVIAYVEKNGTDSYMRAMAGIFGNENIYRLGIRKSGACRVGIGDE